MHELIRRGGVPHHARPLGVETVFALAFLSTVAIVASVCLIVPHAERAARSPQRLRVATPLPDRWRSLTVSGLGYAEKVLDELEALGYSERQLVVLSDSTFLVRWRKPAATPFQ
jgi:hypothetical protein